VCGIPTLVDPAHINLFDFDRTSMPVEIRNEDHSSSFVSPRLPRSRASDAVPQKNQS
jgi:hypothetical protein